MPGKRKGPGKWIENRAERILAKGDLQSKYGPEGGKRVAFAIATQQAHKLNKTPKKGAGPGGMYGTREGKAEARSKYDRPKSEYQKTAAVLDELQKIARCWKKPFSKGSCRPKSKTAGIEYRGHTFPGYNSPVPNKGTDQHKMMVLAKKGDQVKLVRFGHKGYGHNISPERKKNYLTRSAGIRNKSGELTKDDKFSANYWARRELWPKGEADGKSRTQKDKVAAFLTRVKTANIQATSRDNRTPFVGKTQYPTESSKQFAKKKLDQSTSKAEVGPAPLMGKLDKTKMVPLGSVVPKMPTAKGSLPMVKTSSKIASDPLVKYLQKHAKVLEDNAEEMAKKVPPTPLQTKNSDFTGLGLEKKVKDQNDELQELFDGYKSSVGL